MQSVHLNIHDSVYEQFLSFLGKFKNSEVVIVEEKEIEAKYLSRFEIDKIELQKDYEHMKSGKSKMYSQEEFEAILEQRFSSKINI